MTKREAFRKNLNGLMYRDFCTQSDLAKYLDMSPQTISLWVKGLAYPRTDTMDKIAKHFGVSVFELVCEENGDEERLLKAFRVLSPKGKEKALERMEELKQLYWYSNEEAL